MDWSQQSLQGKVVNQQTLEAAQTLVPKMKQEGFQMSRTRIEKPHQELTVKRRNNEFESRRNTNERAVTC